MTGLILPPTITEFHFNGPLLSLATNIGMLVGTILWSFGCDIWGRKSVTLPLSFASARASSELYPSSIRWSFNLTLFTGSILGIAMGGSDTFTVLAVLAAASNVGVGGNIPVDSAVFLGASSFQFLSYLVCYAKLQQFRADFLPSSHQYLLTVLSIWWVIGQLLGSLVSLVCVPTPVTLTFAPFNSLRRLPGHS